MQPAHAPRRSACRCVALLALAHTATAFLSGAAAAAAAAQALAGGGGRLLHQQHSAITSTTTAAAAAAAASQKRRGSSLSVLQMGRGNRFRDARPQSKRQARVSQLLTAELATVIRQGAHVKGAKPLEDSVRSKISIVDVNVSPDLRNARVFISIYGDRLEKREAYAWCVKNTGGIRYALSQRLKDMKGVPELTFQQTDIGAAVDVMHLIDQVAGGSAGAAGPGAALGGLDWDDDDDEFSFLEDLEELDGGGAVDSDGDSDLDERDDDADGETVNNL